MKQTTDRLVAATAALWQSYYDHPFVRGIQNGDLDTQKFRFYTIQDYLYLVEYTKVFAIGMTKTSDVEQMRCFAQSIAHLMDFEMNIHAGYMGRFGITREELRTTPMTLENRSYTAYMLSCAQAGGVVEALTAILACALSYEHIGHEILRRNPQAIAHPFYGDWIAGYTCARYAEENQVLCAAINELTASYTEEQYKPLEDIFYTCARYEKAFWDMAWEMGRE